MQCHSSILRGSSSRSAETRVSILRTGSAVNELCSTAEARPVKDEDTLSSLGISSGGVLYFKDLGAYSLQRSFEIVSCVSM